MELGAEEGERAEFILVQRQILRVHLVIRIGFFFFLRVGGLQISK